MKRIAILGSTGSVGTQTLDVIAAFPDRYAAHSLTANTRVDLLEQQIARFRPRMIAVADGDRADRLVRGDAGLGRGTGAPSIHTGVEGLIEAVAHPDVDLVISALPGSAGLVPTLKAIEAGKTIGLANKEILVMAGEVVMESARRNGVDILPVDSEHCAVHQCLAGQDPDRIERVILTASGGPFRNSDPAALTRISTTDALNHPTWNMGRKVTIDSATLMNKGFEVIEAHWLFGLPVSKIDVVIHPQSIIHSMVEMVDGSLLAQMGPTDMRIPIQYALSYPERLETPWPRFDITRSWSLTLDPPDEDTFPCLGLAYEASRRGATAPAVLSTADEMAVEAFLEHRIGFTDIPGIIADAMDRHAAAADGSAPVTLESIVAADRWTRAYCGKKLIAG
ncbi:MAG: 1-deoxy-D-xylulose-5-phosphate reductoisomerase [Gemmatimonadetes bacterium]|nr:1-deoxy-D-xylulose-5-phosphate reductoisomerase [Gemmatimonadota bacterium]